ncbi:hypothetical protein SKAU_G00135920 [Synaphobranchus kaupii]|uniref:Uncharacterized protein n=1 Tax=Synaphobranchus kaupii TaxID=118154 RepID=A0A9Q1J3I1_SYNKA|nr:hypothetical protein SKAU_G00135920 [Synaphobranchus kaupii]
MHDTEEAISVMHLLESNQLFEKVLLWVNAHTHRVEVCYPAGIQFSMEVAALIGDLHTSQVPSWVRTTVGANRKIALWVTAGERCPSTIGLFQEDPQCSICHY